MKIRIHTDALKSSNSDLLWSGALYGLKHLAELGHQIDFDFGELSANQQSLLENEQLQQDSFPENEIDLSVKAESNKLVAYSDTQIVAQAEDWIQMSNEICFPQRKARHTRKTSETQIAISINLDGTGKSNIDTGLGFFNHMLEQIARHGLIDLDIKCEGDLEID